MPTIHRIEVFPAPGQDDPAGAALLGRLRQWSALPVTDVRTSAVYLFADEALGGAPLPVPLRVLGEDLYADPILQRCAVNGESLEQVPFDWYVEVGFRPGVTDNVGRTAQESLQYRLGRELAAGHHVYAATGYFLSGALSAAEVAGLARDWLCNELIQAPRIVSREAWRSRREAAAAPLFQVPRVTLSAPIEVERFALDDPDALLALSRERLLALDARELEAVRAHYAEPAVLAARRVVGLDGRATDVELEVIAQTWSEHCKHKIFNAEIAYTNEHGETETIRSLYKTYIQGATWRVREALGPEDWCLSVFTDNAGVVRFDDRRILYSWIGATRSDWRGQGHFRALTEESEVWALAAGFEEVVVKTKNRYYDMRAVLAQLRFNVVKHEPNLDDTGESKVYLSKPLPAELARGHRSIRTVMLAD